MDQKEIVGKTEINQNLVNMQYEIEGFIVKEAKQLLRDMKTNPKKYPFKKLLFLQMGNPHLIGQPPITWYREVLSLLQAPHLLLTPKLDSLYPVDAIEKAREILQAMPRGLGAYSAAAGADYCRNKVKSYIEKRDGYECNVEDVFLIQGATAGIESILKLVIGSSDTGVLVPIPQYPIYNALIKLYGGVPINYELDEGNGWNLNLALIKEAINNARAKGIVPKAFVLINPGNPTGSVASYDDLKQLVQLCKEEGILIMADEVYQENIYNNDHAFHSIKKVVRDLGNDYNNLEFVSFHSTSKGFVGECGRRGGYMEVCGLSSFVKQNLQKLQELFICPNTDGQIVTTLMVDSPTPGMPSYTTFLDEKNKILDDLSKKADLIYKEINSLEGASCQPILGAMYAYVKINLSPLAIEAANSKKCSPDQYYALSLLHATGIVSAPGITFGHTNDNFYIRLTFLPCYQKLKQAMIDFKKHHISFIKKNKQYNTLEIKSNRRVARI